MFGYEKNVRANLTAAERDALQRLAHDLLRLNGAALDLAVDQGELEEICHAQCKDD